jgi:hypothetical protein
VNDNTRGVNGLTVLKCEFLELCNNIDRRKIIFQLLNINISPQQQHVYFVQKQYFIAVFVLEVTVTLAGDNVIFKKLGRNLQIFVIT